MVVDALCRIGLNFAMAEEEEEEEDAAAVVDAFFAAGAAAAAPACRCQLFSTFFESRS